MGLSCWSSRCLARDGMSALSLLPLPLMPRRWKVPPPPPPPPLAADDKLSADCALLSGDRGWSLRCWGGW